MKRKIKLKNIWLHFRKIQIHRKWVRYYCFLAGIPWRGLTHDLSKYNPIEFFESAKYYVGTSSPINEAKKEQGISYAWLHHKGRNKHHYEYWADNFDSGGTIHMMPLKDFTELVCDYLGAGRAYYQDDFSYTKELKWWENKRSQTAMNEKNKHMLDIIFSDFATLEKFGLITSSEALIKSGYIKRVWETNK